MTRQAGRRGGARTARSPSAEADSDETVDGTIERFVFRDEDRGFAVARVSVVGADPGSKLVTVVGDLAGTEEGMPLRLRGQWVEDPRFGRQLRVSSYQPRAPETTLGVERFLRLVAPGVGPTLAHRIVERFGMEALEIAERSPDLLADVPGIGQARADAIVEAIRAQRHVQDAMVLLCGHGVSAAVARRVAQRYGTDAVSVVRANPYRLAREVWGVGFQTADQLARALGLPADSPERAAAGLLFSLESSAEAGHLFLSDAGLVSTASDLLGLAPDQVAPELATLDGAGVVVREVLPGRGPCSMLPWAREAEVSAAELLVRLVRSPAPAGDVDPDDAIRSFEETGGVALAAQQRRAVAAALRCKCTVVTGGPGVGKTTVVRAIVHASELGSERVALVAPTGRAAKRLAQATSREATTVHRLLEFSPRTGGFRHGLENPVDVDVLVVDESSMVDAELFAAIVSALRPAARLVLVGDVDQLPSIGAGAVLSDVIASGAAEVVRLTEIFRQASASQIVVAAHAINRGDVPTLDQRAAEVDARVASDFYFVPRDEPAAVRDTILELVARRIPDRFGLDPVRDVQVLTPMRRTELGTTALNGLLQERLVVGGGPEITRGDRVYRCGDKVMQLRNDYDRAVFNGDVGIVQAIDTEGASLVAEFDGRVVSYARADLDQLVHAYAVTVHKSQGSEYPAVVIPVTTQHYVMLQRGLLYTAVTRGRRLVVLVGSRRAVAIAVRNADAARRNTWLAERIRRRMREEPDL